MSSPFAQPSAGGDKFEPKDFNGNLILVFPKSYNPNAQTKFGASTSADCDIIIIDRPGPDGKPLFLANARLFGNLANSVRDSIGGQVLGRIGQVPTNQGNPAWVLNNYTDMDVQMALPHLQAYQAGQFKAPVNPNPASAPSQSAAPAAPQNWQQDAWAGMNAAPAQQYAPPAPTPAPQSVPVAPPAADPHSAFLASRGMDPNAVAAMDPATRAAVAAQLGYQG